MNDPPGWFQLGDVIAGRRLDAIAGRGGMGVVFRVWNLRLRRVEALKVITERYARDRLFRDRFEREKEIVANITHPHVVTLYDSDEGPNGQLFLAMQYVDGTNLDAISTRGRRLRPRIAAELIMQVAEALDVAHAQGLVHRDVKPANILVAGEGETSTAYLTDFGLAKRVESDTGITGAGLVVGTIDYMPPEQLRGLAVDTRADVYALGATLFKALCGQVPFPKEGEIQRSLAKRHGPPPTAADLAVGVPRAFDAVIAKAMAPDPDRRFATAGELGQAALEAAGTPSGSIRGRRLRRGRPQSVEIGSVVDERYRIEGQAGSGGMATVYRATHLRLGRTVAVKIMNRELATDDEFQRRFQNEAKAASEIDHENVIPVLDFGEDAHGLYLVMRYVERNLKEVLRDQGPFEPAQAVAVVEQVAAALDAAHASGLLHRDVKPGNILIDQSAGRIYLADFGLVRYSRDDRTGSEVLGTDYYMAPERRHREETKLGDVYSLGCVLWEMLAGLGTPRPGRTAAVEQHNVPPYLCGVVDKAVSDRPRERFGSAGDLARAARAALEGMAPAPTAGSAPAPPADSAPTLAIAVDHDPLMAGLGSRLLVLREAFEAAPAPDAARTELAEITDPLRGPVVIAVLGDPDARAAALIDAARPRLGSDAIIDPKFPPDCADAFLLVISGDPSRDTGAVTYVPDAPEPAATISAVNTVAIVPIDSGQLNAEGSAEGSAARDHSEALRAALGARVGGLIPVVEAVGESLYEQSTFDELWRHLHALGRRARALRADAALQQVESFSWRHQMPALRDEIDRMRLEAPLLELLRLFASCATGEIDLDPPRLDELRQLVLGRSTRERLGLSAADSDDAVRDAAAGRARAWQTWSQGGNATLQGRRVATRVGEVYMQLGFPE